MKSNQIVNKGSSVVMVTISAACLIITALTVFILVAESNVSARAFNDIDGLYYICEAGMERASAMVINEMDSLLKGAKISVNNNEPIDTNSVKTVLDSFTIPYFAAFTSGSINQYQKYTGGNGKDDGNGSDTMLLSTYMEAPSYYNVSSIQLRKTSLSCKEGVYLYDIIFDLSTEGKMKNAHRTINAVYTASFKLNHSEHLENGNENFLTVQSSALKIISWQD